MPEMHLRQPGFIYISCEPFTKNKERIQKFKETEDSGYIYQNKLDKACFQHDVAYGNFKYLTRRTSSDKISHHKAFSNATNPKHDGYQCRLASVVYKFFDKKTSVGATKNENMSNKEVAGELHKPIIRKFNKRKVNSSFIDKIWGADLIDMQLISIFIQGIYYVLLIFSVITHGLFHWNIQKVLQLSMLFKTIHKNVSANKKYG